MNIFPVDIESVKAYGVERWHQEGSIWRVTDEEHLSLYDDVEQLYVNAIAELPPDLGDVVSVFPSLTKEYAELLHAMLMVKRLREAGFLIKSGESTCYYKGLVTTENEIQGLFAYFRSLPQFRHYLWPQTPSFWQRVRGYLRKRRSAYRYQGLAGVGYTRTSGQSPYLALRAPGEMLERYAASQGKQISLVYPFPLRQGGLNDALDVVPAVSCLMEGIRKLATKYGVQLENKHVYYLQKVTTAVLQGAAHNIAEIRRLLRGRRRSSILLNALGAHLTRSVCVAGRREGYEIVGVSHGNDVGMHQNRATAFIDWSMADVYVVPTSGAVELFSKAKKKYLLASHHKVKVVSANYFQPHKREANNKRIPLPATIKSVMVLEYPLTPFRHRNTWGFWPYQLDLMLNVAQSGRKLGYTMIIKRHPDQLRASEGLYEPYFDQVLTEPFETLYEMADAYFFPSITTTTFGFALLSNRPIILLETMLKEVWPEAQALLRKRCRVIPSWTDDNGRLVFDEDALAEALREKPEPPNEEFVRRYMFP